MSLTSPTIPMIFAILTIQLEQLQQGQRTNISLDQEFDVDGTKYKGKMFEFPIQKREIIRFYFEAHNSVLKFCTMENIQQCYKDGKQMATNASSKYGYIEATDYKILFMNPKMYVLVISKGDATAQLTIHAALELTEGRTFTHSSLLSPDFNYTNYRYAFFVGSDTDLLINLTNNVSDVKCSFMPYIALHNTQQIEQCDFAAKDKVNETNTIKQDFLKGRIGWIYLQVDASNYTIHLSQESAMKTLQYDKREEVLKACPLAEQQTFVKIVHNKGEVNVKRIAISAFTQQPQVYGFIELELSEKIVPSGFFFGENGVIDFSKSAVQFYTTGTIESLIDMPHCVGQNCDIYVSLSFNASTYLLSKSPIDYQFISIKTIVQKNAYALEHVNRPITLMMNESNNFTVDVIVDQHLNDNQNYINSMNQQGYMFTLEFLNEDKDIRGVLNVYDLPVERAFSMVKDNCTLQAMISSIQGPFYLKSGVYFLTFQSTKPQNASFRSKPSYSVMLSSPVRLNVIHQHDHINFHANVSIFPNKEFMVCFSIGTTNMPAINENSFKLFGSTKHYYPDPLAKDTYEYVSDKGIDYEDKKMYCIQGTRQHDENVYVTLQNIDCEYEDFQFASVAYGQPYYFLDQIQFDQLNYFSSFSNVKLLRLITPLSDQKARRSLIQRQVYFELNLEASTDKADLQIIDHQDNSTVYSKTIPAGQTYFSDIIEIPIDRPLLLNLSSEKQPCFAGEIFFGYIFDKQIATLGYLQNSYQPILIKVNINEYQEPVIALRKYTKAAEFQIDLVDLVVYICKDQPKISKNDQYAKNCTEYVITNKDHEALIFPMDIHLTQSPANKKYPQLDAGDYYVSILPKQNQPKLKLIEFEIFHSIPLLDDVENPVRLQADPLMSTLGFHNESWFVFDVLVDTKPLYKNQLYIDLQTNASMICLTYDEPLTFVDYLNNVSCAYNVTNASNITISVPQSVTYFKRVFVNVLGNENLISKLHTVYVASFVMLEQNFYNNATKKYEPAVYNFEVGQNDNRCSDDTIFVAINATNTTHLELSNQLYATIKDFQKMIEDGSSNITRMYVSDSIYLNLFNSIIDDTKAIQVVNYRVQKSSEIVFVKIELDKKFPTNKPITIELRVGDDKSQMSQRFQFMKPHNYTLTRGEVQYNFFRGIHTPITHTLEFCRVQSGSKVVMYNSPYTLLPNESVWTFNQTQTIKNTTKTMAHAIPGNGQDPRVYTYMNFFFGVQNKDSDMEYIARVVANTNRPVIPRDAAVILDKVDGKFQLKFRSAGVNMLRGYNTITNINVQNQSWRNTVSYRVMALPDKLPSDAVVGTQCGLEKFATAVTDWFVIPQIEDTQVHVNFTYPEAGDHTQFVIIVRNDNLDVSAVYPPFSFQTVKNKQVNQGAMVSGIVFGVVGGCVIVGLVTWLLVLKYKSSNGLNNSKAVYSGVEEK